MHTLSFTEINLSRLVAAAQLESLPCSGLALQSTTAADSVHSHQYCLLCHTFLSAQGCDINFSLKRTLVGIIATNYQ